MVAKAAVVNYTVIILHSPFPTSTPTSQPSCSAGTDGLTDTCIPCEPGFYSNVASKKYSPHCQPCPQGTYSDEYRSGSCKQCPYPTTTYREGLDKCFSYSLNTGNTMYYSTIATIVTVAFLGASLSGNKKRVVMIITLWPLFDFITDVLYWQTTVFYGLTSFILCGIFLIVSNWLFIRELKHLGSEAYPRIFFPKTFENFKEKIANKSYVETFLIYAFFFVVGVVSVAFKIFWFIFGMFCFSTKIFAVGKVKSVWLNVWTFSSDFSYMADEDIDTGTFL